MRTSIGLLPDVPTCRYHSVKLKPRRERTPRWQQAYAEFVSPQRVVYRCTVKGCPVVSCGVHEYKAGREDRRQMKSLEKP